MESVPKDVSPAARAVIEQELASAHATIRATLARAASGYAIAAGPEHGQYLRFAQALSDPKRADTVALVTRGGEDNIRMLREGKVQLTDGYVVIRDGELFIIGCQINPLKTASTHVRPDAVRTKKLLLHKDEIRRLVGKVEQKGYTLVPLNLHWKNGKVKAEIALAKGKAEHDKRDTIRDREVQREMDRAIRRG